MSSAEAFTTFNTVILHQHIAFFVQCQYNLTISLSESVSCSIRYVTLMTGMTVIVQLFIHVLLCHLGYI